MKMLVNLMCCFVPDRQRRKEIRDKAKFKRELSALDYERLTVSGTDALRMHGFHFAYSAMALGGLTVVQEVFASQEYHYALDGESVVIDVGMNYGIASLYFAARQDVKAVYGFEPFRETFEKALVNFTLNPDIGKKIQPFNVGLGKDDQELALDYWSNMSTVMTTVKPMQVIQPKLKSQSQKEIVQIKNAAVQIGQIIDRHRDARIVFKCDCEGAEKEIFERLDSAGLLGKIDVILLEYHFSYDDVLLDLLKRNHYVCFKRKVIQKASGEVGIIRAVRTQTSAE